MKEGKGGSQKEREREDTREQRCTDLHGLRERREVPVDIRRVFLGFSSIEFVTFFSSHTPTLDVDDDGPNLRDFEDHPPPLTLRIFNSFFFLPLILHQWAHGLILSPV